MEILVSLEWLMEVATAQNVTHQKITFCLGSLICPFWVFIHLPWKKKAPIWNVRKKRKSPSHLQISTYTVWPTDMMLSAQTKTVSNPHNAWPGTFDIWKIPWLLIHYKSIKNHTDWWFQLYLRDGNVRPVQLGQGQSASPLKG